LWVPASVQQISMRPTFPTRAQIWLMHFFAFGPPATFSQKPALDCSNSRELLYDMFVNCAADLDFVLHVSDTWTAKVHLSDTKQSTYEPAV